MGIYFEGNDTGLRYGNDSRLIFADLPAITASFWIENLDLSGNAGLFEISNPSGSARMEALWSAGTNYIQAGGRALDSDGFQTVSTSTGVLNSELYHIVIIFDYTNDEAYIYVDSVLVGSDLNMGWTAGNCSNTAPEFADFGSVNNLSLDSTANYYDIRFYKRVLTVSEILTIYASEGKDDIIDNLELWIKATEAAPGTAITTALIKDYSENGWTAFSISGDTADYAEDPISIP